MSNDQTYTPMIWKVVSLIILVVGVLIGLILFVSGQPLFSFLFIFLGIVGFLPLLALSQVFQFMLHNPQTDMVKEHTATQNTSNVSSNPGSNWTLSQAERKALVDYYENQGQNVDDILVSPVPNYVAVVVDGNLDVVMLNGADVVLLSKMDVDAIPELSRWIEEEVLQTES